MTTESVNIYYPDDKQVWVPAEIISEVDTGSYEMLIYDSIEFDYCSTKIITNSSDITTFKNSFPSRTDQFPEDGFDDLLSLNSIHEGSILDNLELRFKAENPYTNAGNICIAMNPYQWLNNLYSEDTKAEYMENNSTERSPHIYDISAQRFSNLAANPRNQSILVSGESGAGKTESVKLLMSHLAEAAVNKDSAHIVNKILESNPLLESFGNAKTEKNDNSSRFGKYAKLYFDEQSQLIGSYCSVYLLEKSRVVGQSNLNDRNFHIFYQILGAPSASKIRWSLMSKTAADFRYTCNESKSTSLDHEMFLQTLKALDLLHVPKFEQENMCRLLSGILFLGQISFSSVNDESVVDKRSQDFRAACNMLGFDPDSLGDKLTCRSIEVAKLKEIRQRRHSLEETVVHLTQQQSADYRDALAKDVYDRLFLWLVNTLNNATQVPQTDAAKFVGLLDIFGFENLQINCFEQLCINYSCEKLQHKYVQDTFRTMKHEYEEEGLSSMDQILFRDNSEIINLFESQSRTGKLGLFDLMNEECMLPQGNDIKLVNRMNSTWKDQNYGFSKDRLDPKNTFRIMHYANQVLYVVDNFVERNRDHVSLEILALMSESSNNLLSKLYVDQGSRSVDSENIQSTQNIKLDENGKPVNIISAVSKRNQKVTSFIKSQTAATKMRAQLDELMTQIFQTDISYIRCIKPNSTQLPTEFDRRMVLNQLNSSGVLDALRVTRAAYPYQISHADFLELVSDVIPVSAAKFNTLSTAGKCKKYLQYLPNFVNATSLTNKVGEDCFRQNRYEVGKSKVFFSNFYQTALEGLKHNLYSIQASKIQAAFRCKQRFIENLNKSAVKLQATYRMHRAQVAYKEQFKRELKASVSLQRGVRLFLYKKEIARKQDWAVGQLQAWARMLPIFRSYRRLIQVRDQEKCKRMLLHEARLKRRSTLDHVRRSLGNAHADCNTNCNCSIM